MPAGKAVAAAGKAAMKEASKAATTKKPTKGVVAQQKRQPVSSTLKNFLGVSETSRMESIKQLWSYIKAHRLQDPEDGKQIICDEKLKLVLGKERVNFTEISGLLSPHFPPKKS